MNNSTRELRIIAGYTLSKSSVGINNMGLTGAL